LSRLIASGVILRKERGVYTLAENVLPEYTYRPSEDEKDLFQQLKHKFPLLDLCVWSPRTEKRSFGLFLGVRAVTAQGGREQKNGLTVWWARFFFIYLFLIRISNGSCDG
jgi:hypothetical protein